MGLLISFINSCFNGKKTVVDLTYEKNEHVGSTIGAGKVIINDISELLGISVAEIERLK